jgi:hypothetical protein
MRTGAVGTSHPTRPESPVRSGITNNASPPKVLSEKLAQVDAGQRIVDWLGHHVRNSRYEFTPIFDYLTRSKPVMNSRRRIPDPFQKSGLLPKLMDIDY